MAAHVPQRTALAGLSGFGQMSDRPNQRTRTDRADEPPLRLSELLLLAFLWMIFGFMLWYYLAVFLGAPARLAADAILGQLLGNDFSRIVPEPNQNFLFQVETAVRFTFRDGSTDALGFIVNPLIFSYGLPLLFGLVMGSDDRLRRKFAVMLLGYVVITAVQIWGVVFQSLKVLAFDFGEQTRAVIVTHGINETLVAVGYQLGTLILPALAPIILWVLTHRRLVEQFVGWEAGRPDDRGRH
ncbi:MAG: hypothetical protein P8Y52_08910 [Xanthomonadales bacterium]